MLLCLRIAFVIIFKIFIFYISFYFWTHLRYVDLKNNIIHFIFTYRWIRRIKFIISFLNLIAVRLSNADINFGNGMFISKLLNRSQSFDLNLKHKEKSWSFLFVFNLWIQKFKFTLSANEHSLRNVQTCARKIDMWGSSFNVFVWSISFILRYEILVNCF